MLSVMSRTKPGMCCQGVKMTDISDHSVTWPWTNATDNGSLCHGSSNRLKGPNFSTDTGHILCEIWQKIVAMMSHMCHMSSVMCPPVSSGSTLANICWLVVILLRISWKIQHKALAHGQLTALDKHDLVLCLPACCMCAFVWIVFS